MILSFLKFADCSSVIMSFSTISRNVVLGEKENRLILTVTTSKTTKLVPSYPENNMVMEHQKLVKETVVETIICRLVGDKIKKIKYMIKNIYIF